MSARPDYNEAVGASRHNGGKISKKEEVNAHNNAFGDFMDAIQKGMGIPGDEVLYKDPMAFAAKDPVNMVGKMFASGWDDAFGKFNDAMRRHGDLSKAAEEVAKSVGRTSFSLPIFISPDVFITDEKQTPVADMLPRVAIKEDTYKTDEITDHGAVSRFYEPGSNAGTDETWAENDDTTTTHTYDVVPYGRQNEVTDFVQLAASNLRNTQSLTEEAMVRAMRHYEEAQVIQGNGTATNFTGNDTGGFAGLPDLVASAADQLTDDNGGEISKRKVREALARLTRAGASEDNVVHLTDHHTYGKLKDEVDDYVRYTSPGSDLDFGFRALDFDGTPVLKSHGCPDVDNGRYFVSFDASAHNMAMLADATLHPLAKTTPAENMAVDAYGTFASRSTERIEIRYNLA